MARLRIPDSQLLGIEYINSMSESQIHNLYNSLRLLPKGTTMDELESQINSVDLSIDSAMLSATLFSLSGLTTNVDSSEFDRIAKELVDSYLEEQEEDKLIGFQRNDLEERLRFILLESDSLRITSEAIELVYNGKVFSLGEIVPNINMIFDEDHKPSSAIITHRLKIHYSENAQRKNLSLTMDAEDLLQLKAQIDNALLKEQNIKNNNREIKFLNLTS